MIDSFTAYSEKNLLDLTATQLIWQHVTTSSSYSRLLVIMTQLQA